MTAVAIRPATPADAAAMARFVDLAGEGLPYYLWSQLAEPGQDPWDVGVKRAAREQGGFSYTHAMMLEADGDVAGCLVGYPLSPVPEPFDRAQIPPLFVPMLELEALAPGTWYINVLAIDPTWQGQGLGTRLLAEADTRATQTNSRGTSLIVADDNTPARRFYARHGYRETATRPMVKEAWQSAGESWILCVKRCCRSWRRQATEGRPASSRASSTWSRRRWRAESAGTGAAICRIVSGLLHA